VCNGLATDVNELIPMDRATLSCAQSTITLYPESIHRLQTPKTHLGSLAIIPFNRPYDFLLILQCNCL